MSGTAIIKSLLGANAALVAQVPATHIFVGDVPLNTTLPAISVKLVGGIERLTVAMTETRLVTDRIQVSMLTSTPSQGALWLLIRAALPHTRGVVSTFNVDSILPDAVGPPIPNQNASIYQESQDYMVKFVR